MADITKCEGAECLLKKSCRRYLETSNPFRQSYFVTPPLLSPSECNAYWPWEATSFT